MQRKTKTRKALWQPQTMSVICRLPPRYPFPPVLIGENYEKIDYVDRARKKAAGNPACNRHGGEVGYPEYEMAHGHRMRPRLDRVKGGGSVLK